MGESVCLSLVCLSVYLYICIRCNTTHISMVRVHVCPKADVSVCLYMYVPMVTDVLSPPGHLITPVLK